MEKQTRLAKAKVAAFVRTSADRVEVARVLSDATTKEKLKMTVRPPKVSSALRKTAAALILAPDPVTGVAGVALLGVSVVTKKREPANIEDLAKEAEKVMRDLRSML